ncbi:MAG: flagellar hook-associated protein FlgK [Selenomonadaceae bacterium]|nr:flagellar hook-associated protein FlgK [Selenomonadaceae bacterium]
MPMFTGLNTMVRGIYVNQTALNTTGHNIVNADTKGYSRQAVNIIATQAEDRSSVYGNVMVGTGADVQSVTRSRDVFADVQYRNETATMSYYETLETNYDKLEVIFNDSDEQGLQSKILAFYQSLVDLSTESSNAPTRVNVIEQGKNLSDAILTTTTQLQEQIDYNYYYLGKNIDKVNELLGNITKLNKLVVSYEANGASANDLRDQRDLLVDELTTYMPINVVEDEFGNYQLTSGGTSLVIGTDRLHLEFSRGIQSKYFGENYGVTDYSISIKESDVAFLPTNGILKANLDAVEDCKTFLNSLVDISAFFLTTFNDQHKQGYDMSAGDKTTTLKEVTYSVSKNGQINVTGLQENANVLVPNTANFFGEDGVTYVYGYDKKLDAKTVTAVRLDGTFETYTGADIINAFKINEKFNGTEGYIYVAAATAYDDQHDYSSVSKDSGTSVIDSDTYYSRIVDWNERTGDGTNAVFLSELFNMPYETILTAGRSNAFMSNRYAENYPEINALGGESINSAYIASVTQLSLDTETVDTRIAQQQSVMTQVENWRSAANGVDWNEELTNMLKYQKGFVACSRCLNAMDECLDKLVNSTGAVGR